MGEDRTSGGFRRVNPEEARVHGSDPGAVRVHEGERGSVADGHGQNERPGAENARTRGYGSNIHRASDDDAGVRRDGSRWGDILVGALTALTTFLLLELLVWGMRLPAGSDRLDTSYGIGVADWVTGLLGLLAFLVGGYIAGMSSAIRDRRPGRPGMRAGLMVWLLGTVLILALSAFGPEILGGLFGAPADVMGTDVSADNAGSVVETIRNDALGAFFSLLSWGLAAALGGWLGNLTQEQV